MGRHSSSRVSLRIAHQSHTGAKSHLSPTYSINVPKEMGDELVEAGITEFVVEYTDLGILYRPAASVRPAWLKTGRGDKDTT